MLSDLLAGSSISTTIVLSLLLLVLGIVMYLSCLDPLRGVPGPRLAVLSNAWYAYQARNGRMLKLGTTLHEKYGRAVRVGPREVWFDSKEACKAIYSPGNGFEKSDFYHATALHRPPFRWSHFFNAPTDDTDTLDLLSDRNMTRYRLQRRLIGKTYHISSLKRHEHHVDAVITRAIARIRALNGAEVDLKEWMHIITVECLGAVVLSWSPGFLEAGTDRGSGAHGYAGWRRKSVFGLFPWAVVLETLSGHLGRAFAMAWGITHQPPGGKGFKPFFPAVYKKISGRWKEAQRRSSGKKISGKNHGTPSQDDLLDDLIALHQAKPQFTETYLRRMAMTNFGAGHETMTSALTAVMAMIGTHPIAQSKIASEIASNCDASSPISFDDASRLLPFTMAAIREAQRLHPAIGMSLPRRVPKNGLRLHGHYFPPGTTVGCSPIALHRNKEVFGDDAGEFRPERWLNESEDGEGRDRVRDMERFNLIWGGGARTCPGRHLAELVVWKVVPRTLREFEVEVVTMPRDEEVVYYFMAMLTGVRVRFKARPASEKP